MTDAQTIVNALMIVATSATLVAVLLAVSHWRTSSELRVLLRAHAASVQEVARLRYYVDSLSRMCTLDQQREAASRANACAWQDYGDNGAWLQPTTDALEARDWQRNNDPRSGVQK